MVIDGGWILASLVLPIVTATVTGALLVGWFSGGRHDESTEQWANSHGVRVGPAEMPFVRWYRTLDLTLRVIGGVAGVVIGSATDRAFGIDSSSGVLFWGWVMAGWTLGAAWAERRLVRPGEAGAASLVPRRVVDYLGRPLLWAPAATAVVTTVGASIGALITYDAPHARTWEAWSDRSLASAPIASALIALGALGLQRSVVARPQPVMSPGLVAADDAIRSTAVHRIGAGALAAELCVLTALVLAIVMPLGSAPLGLRGWLPAVPFVAGVLAWRYWSFWPWRVQRTRSPEAASS